MCGIFGITANRQSTINTETYRDIIRHLFLLSESRGKEAAGFAAISDHDMLVYKTPFPASTLVKSDKVWSAIDSVIRSQEALHFTAIGHSRLVTNGYEHFNANNQPIIKKHITCIHNGIVVNVQDLWKQYSDEQKETDLDSEIIPTLIRKFYQENGNLKEAIQRTFTEIYGMTSIAMLFHDLNNLLLVTNNGSLYYCSSTDRNAFVFASEFYILKTLIRESRLQGTFHEESIIQLRPNTACLLDLDNTETSLVQLNSRSSDQFSNVRLRKGILGVRTIHEEADNGAVFINTSLEHDSFEVPRKFIDEFQNRQKEIAQLKRCTKCLLPETFPYILFDADGVCNYCNNYSRIECKGTKAFAEYVKTFRRRDGRPDCLIPFSGGRDSSFVLHYVREELGMTPLAYSYDWGMITDLARRNQARMCGKLGVEHIVVSADIRKKRANIRENVLAWLRRPNLGTIPLFMAGDKQYFYYGNLLMEQNNLQLSILGENMLETTNFKSGFCGIPPTFGKHHTYSLSIRNKLKMLLFYGSAFLFNPAYLNSSLLDTFDAFKSYYVIEHNNINLYSFIQWDEKKILDLLTNRYDWETDPGTSTTWRIGDGTAAFYNYIYYMVTGFTENDTFRSNQIREEMLTREEALMTVQEENRPRFDSIKWYCNTIGINFTIALNTINQIRPLYRT